MTAREEPVTGVDREGLADICGKLCNAADLITVNLDRDDRRWRPTRAHYEGARNDIRRCERALDAILATTPSAPSPGVEGVAVPADRVLAADILDEVSSLLDHVGIGQVADLIRAGEYDEHEIMSVIARHRGASLLSAAPTPPTTGGPASGEVERERDEARKIVRDIYWMARRYADGRRSYAVGMFNDAVHLAYEAGWLEHKLTGEPPYARDGDFDAEYRTMEQRALAAEAALASSQASPVGEREKRLEEAARVAIDWLRSAPLESGYCCCGSPVASHGMGDGHSPVDELSYSAGQLQERFRAALGDRSDD